MKQNDIKIIRCKNLDLAASIEYHYQELHDSYFPFNMLFIIRKGNLYLSTDDMDYAFGPNKIVLIKRFTKGSYRKTFSNEEGFAHVYALVFHDELIKDVMDNIQIENEVRLGEKEVPIAQEIIIGRNIEEFYQYFEEIFDTEKKVDEVSIEKEVKHSLQRILEVNPEIYTIFLKASKSIKASLRDFMEYNYKETLHLRDLAKLSGRSLATFYRDFAKEFDQSPHKWILNRRLAEAHSLLLVKTNKSNQIYLDLGFKDLAHFSRSFKKKYGYSPSQIN